MKLCIYSSMDGLTFTYQFHRRANNLQKDENYAFKQFKRLCAWTSIYIFHGRASNKRMKLCIQTGQAPVSVHGLEFTYFMERQILIN